MRMMMPLHAAMTQVQLRNKDLGTCTYVGTICFRRYCTYVAHAILYCQVLLEDSQLQSKQTQIIVKRRTNKYV